MTDCAWFVFKNMTPQFKDGPDVRQFMEEHVGDRPTTVGLLQVAFKLWQDQQNGTLQSQLFEQSREPSIEEQNLDDLSDAEIAALFQGATREHVRRET